MKQLHRIKDGPVQRAFSHWNHFCFGLFSMIGGLYIWFHQGYLDDPRVTPPPPPSPAEHAIFAFADDWWFSLWLIICGIAILVGVFHNRRLLRDGGLVALSPAMGALSVAFIVRGLFDVRFNLTWVFALLMLFLLVGTLIRGDTHGY